MAETKSLGQVAYEGFYQKSGSKDILTDAPLPFWAALQPRVREAWEAAGQAILNTQRDPNSVNHPAQTPENKSPNQPYPGQKEATISGQKSEALPVQRPRTVTEALTDKSPTQPAYPNSPAKPFKE